jgi:ABC-type Fe3+ transport system substrate-binding protein
MVGMKKPYFSVHDTLHDIITRYPQTLEYFTSHGFPQFSDREQLKRLGSMLTFEAAMKSRKKNPETFMELLNEAIEQSLMLSEDGVSRSEDDNALTVAGILPCPVKIPLIDRFESFADTYRKKHGRSVSYNLQSASGGLGWMEDIYRHAVDEHQLPDLVLSAGFELFFDQRLVGRFRDAGTFADLSSLTSFNRDFDGLRLKDPKGNYSILAGVPAIFLVDTLELGDRKVPRTWEDLLSEDLEGSVSLPVEDLDLFNAVTLRLEHRFGMEAVERLGRNMLRSMHPSQMVREGSRKGSSPAGKPAVTVLPWFFTRMIFSGTSLQIVWPEDGAILSPIFAAAKRSKADQLSEILSLFESREIGQLLRDKGMFPCVHPEVENDLPENAGFQWLGWDAVYSRDMGKLIQTCTSTFMKAMGEEKTK